MSTANKKEAIRQYKEREANAGIFVLRAASGEAWVGSSPDLGAIKNRLLFDAKMGSSRVKGLQPVWNAAKGEGFAFEVLENLDPELSDMARERLMKERADHWRTELRAQPA